MESFALFLNAVVGVIGSEHVIVEEGDIEMRARFTEPARFDPIAYLHPANADEISKIMLLANEYGTGISVSGRGKNWGFGSATPSKNGAVVMLLDRLDKIVHVDEGLAYAVLEPGVTYEQLNNYLKHHRLKLWIDTVDGAPSSSVIGNALDRGLGLTPYGDHCKALCGLEVILPTGEKLRTGGGPRPEYATWNLDRAGSGPDLEGLFSQSNFGVVTLAGIWLMPEPACMEMYVIAIEKAEHLSLVLDRLRPLYLSGVLNARSHILNEFAFLSASIQASDIGQQAALTDEELDSFRRAHHVAGWTLITALYGEPEQIQVNRRILQRALSPYVTIDRITQTKANLVRKALPWLKSNIPVVSDFVRQIVLGRILGKSIHQLDILPSAYDLHKGIPTERILKSAYFWSSTRFPASDVDPARDGCGEVWFTPVVPFRGEDVVLLIARIRHICRIYSINQFTSIKLISNRAIMVLTLIQFDHRKQEDRHRVKKAYDHLCKATMEAGVQQHRVASIGWGKLEQWTSAHLHFCNALKRALDPKGVLAAGKYGIDGKITVVDTESFDYENEKPVAAIGGFLC